MQLIDLFFDRFLYRKRQNVETQNATEESVNNAPPPSTAVASGNTVTDVNTNAETINGGQITPGTLPGPSDIANWGWTQTSAFSAASATTVTWGAGTFTSSQGVSYAIAGGTTGAMGLRNYIYLDVNISTTAYQVSTGILDPIGSGKVLIAIADAGSPLSTYNLVQATQVIADNILANTIGANKMNVGQLSAISADVGTLTAGNINGLTITGGTVRTSSTGTRIEMNGGANAFQVYSSSVLRAAFAGTTLNFYNSGGSAVGGIFVDGSGNFNVGANAGLGGPDLLLFAASLGSIKLIDTGVENMSVTQTGVTFLANRFTLSQNQFQPVSDNTKGLGANGSSWANLWLKRISQPAIAYGYVTAAGGGSRNNISFSVSHAGGTGVYLITPTSPTLNSTTYTVQATPFAAGGGGAPGAKVSVLTSSSFTVTTFNELGVATDFDFMFALFIP